MVKPPVLQPAPKLLQALPALAVLIAAAVIWYFLKWPILVFGSVGVFLFLLIHLIHWAGQRWPRTTLYVGWFILGMMRGGRRR